MRVAIVGTGNIARLHAQILSEMGHEIVVAIGRDEKRTEQFVLDTGAVSASVDFQEALSPVVEVVHICTPPMLHYQMVKRALEAGKHVICEKPFTIDPDEALELAQLATQKGVVHGLNFNVRFHEGVQRMREFISSGAIGEIRLVHGNYLQEFHLLPTGYSWRYREELAGPMRATTEIGSHWMDLARYLTGQKAINVSAIYGKFCPTRFLTEGIMHEETSDGALRIKVNSEDAALVNFRLENGAIGHMTISEVSHGRSNQLVIEVTGSQGSIWWDSQDPYAVHEAKRGTGVQTVTNAFGGGFPNTFKGFFQAVYQDIEKGRPASIPDYPNFWDGVYMTRVCQGIFLSAKEDGRWTSVD